MGIVSDCTTQFETLGNKAAENILKTIDDSQLCFGSLSPFNYMEANLLRMEFTPEFNADKMKTNAKRAFKNL